MIVTICQDISLITVLSIVKRLMSLIQIIVPILLIIFITIAFIKMVKNPEEKNGMKKIKNAFLAAAIVFFVPLCVDVVMYMMGENTSFSTIK